MLQQMLDLFAGTDCQPADDCLAGKTVVGHIACGALTRREQNVTDTGLRQLRRDLKDIVEDFDSRYTAFVERKYIWLHELGDNSQGVAADISDYFFRRFDASRERLIHLKRKVSHLQEEVRELDKQKGRWLDKEDYMRIVVAQVTAEAEALYADFFVASQNFYSSFTFGCAFASYAYWDRCSQRLEQLPEAVRHRVRELDGLAMARRWRKHETGHVALLYREMELLLDEGLATAAKEGDMIALLDLRISDILSRFRLREALVQQ